MTELLPTLQAEATKTAIVEYVTTTIDLADSYAKDAFRSFLRSPDHGIFHGPFLRMRLPFQAAQTSSPLSILPSWFTPYVHQAAAFQRLTTDPAVAGPQDAAGLRIPQPTIVTTGTGSGKTEAFLYPVLDYAVRARADGVHGVKAVILYPMNALANDQAGRLARLIHDEPALNGVTAALYTGEKAGAPRTTMSREGLIEDRYTIRSQAPDIILTNYKMLDELLLRTADRPIWEASARSLRYLVLDEFHTYNGAQGTDVALLIRRLQLLLERLAPGRTNMIPVATSATLGDDRDIAPVAQFASTIFGVEFDQNSVVTESRLDPGDLHRAAGTALGDRGDLLANELPGPADIQPVIDHLPRSNSDQMPDAQELAGAVVDALWTTPPGQATAATLLQQGAASAQDLLLAHPLVGALLQATRAAVPMRELGRNLLPHLTQDGQAVRFLEGLTAALSHVRSQAERNAFPNVEVHLWTREVRRVDRSTSPAASFTWSEETSTHDGSYLPAIYCRHCGRSGWGVSVTGLAELNIKPQRIREDHVHKTGKFRALIYSPGAQFTEDDSGAGIRYLDPYHRALDVEAPDLDAADVDTLPVLLWTGLQAAEKNLTDTCPSCKVEDGIRFVGSSTATLLSVTLSSLFGTGGLDLREKKSLVFTDSVQDAAHRAGFVEARSHTLTLRSAIESAVTDNPEPLADVARRMMQQAVTPEDRYRLLHPSIAENHTVRAYWDPEAPAGARNRATRLVSDRLVFDLELEAGLVGSYGRTLASTGTAAASVMVTEHELDAVSEQALESVGQQMWSVQGNDGSVAQTQGPDPARAHVWIRGILERLRSDGAISHPWLNAYRSHGGGRYYIWGGRKPRSVMPAFPPGRRSPEFASLGPGLEKNGFSDATHSSSWFADWTARCFGLNKRAASHLVRPAFLALEQAGVVDAVAMSKRGRETSRNYGLKPERVVFADLGEHPHVLRCPQSGGCGREVTGLPEVLEAMLGGPCPTGGCRGELSLAPTPGSYYRSLYRADMRRVIAREHTSLLESSTRLGYENAFKASDSAPGAPNVLVATPTLEMGIDIGDLSTVILASIPDSVASYLQRVGRAGRLTGNSLDLALMSTRGRGSGTMDPDFMVNGSVRPPAAYLSAEEILHRQYVAFLMDRMAGDSALPESKRSASVMRSAAPNTFLGELLRDARRNARARLDEFLSVFDLVEDPKRGITQDAVTALRGWATWPDTGQSGLEITVKNAVQRWHAEKDAIRHRRQNIAKLLEDIESGRTVIPADEQESTVEQLRGQQELLDQQDERLGVTEDPEARERELKRLTGSHARLRAEESAMSHEHWISVLERFGLLPNFTLFDDHVVLDATLIWQDDDKQWQREEANYSRSGFTALTEMAPGNFFYAEGNELQITAVDLGTQGAGIRHRAFCPRCGHTQDLVTADDRLTSCPKCMGNAIADAGQVLNVVEMTQVYSIMERYKAKIGDNRDDRSRAMFEVATIPDFTEADVRAQWSIDGTGLGITFRRNTKLTRMNVGRPREGAPEAMLAGQKQRIGGFTICSECGHLDEDVATNNAREHQAWCSQRHVEKPESTNVVLVRYLTTESVVIALPPSISMDSSQNSLWSFYAAIMLGLRERFGGEVGHLGMEVIHDTARNNAPCLLIYDVVPGGTGYLAELSQPESLWDLFRAALRTLQDCPCAHEERAACFRCLLPHVRSSHWEFVQRGRAVEILDSLLGVSGDSAAMGWSVSDSAPAENDDFESHLEQRFRRVFRAAVEKIPGAQVTDMDGDRAHGFSATVGDTRYSLLAQVTLGHTQPDFLLTWPGQHGVRGVAIYLDGEAFHATQKHNVLADDAQKRQALREQGYMVYAVTDKDLKDFEAVQRKESPEPVLADVFWDKIVNALVQANKITAADQAHTLSNPVSQLLALISSGKTDPLKAYRSVSKMLPAMLYTDPAKVSPSRLAQQAAVLLEQPVSSAPDPFPAQDDTVNGTVRRWGALALAASLRGERLHMAAVLDDRPAAIEQADYDVAWRIWLALSNLRQPLDPLVSTWLTTWTAVQETAEEAVSDTDPLMRLLQEAGSRPSPSKIGPVDVAQPAATQLGPQWQSLVQEALTDGERRILEHGGARSWPLPVVGEEVAGVPLDVAWPDKRLAWVSSREQLQEAQGSGLSGWTILGPDVDQALVALEDGLQAGKGQHGDGAQ